MDACIDRSQMNKPIDNSSGIYATDKDGNILYNKDGTPRKKAGRKKGIENFHHFRSKMSAKFMREFSRHFEKHGDKAIKELYEKDPVKYVQIMASMMPKQAEIKQEDVTEHKALSTVELANRIAGLVAGAEAERDREPGQREHADMEPDTGASDGGVLH